MARQFSPQIVTANRLLEGDAVYFTGDGNWSPTHGDAQVARNAEEAEALLAAAARQQHLVVGPYLAEVTIGEDGRPQPAHFREAFRTRGPSNYFHGKQAAGA